MEKKDGKTVKANVAIPKETKELIGKENLKSISDENKKLVAGKKSQTQSKVKGTPKKEVSKKGNGGFKPNPNSKANKIRQMFKEKKEWTLKELTKRSGFKDDANTACMMSIFKNPTRTKELLITEFNKEKQTYSLSR